MTVHAATLLSDGIGKSFKKKPSGAFYYVDGTNSVPLIFKQLRDANAELATLDLYAHGMYVNRHGRGIVGDIAEYIYGHDALQGAFGVALGKDAINKANLDMFGTLKGCFAPRGYINFYVCGVAAVSDESQLKDYKLDPNVWSGNGVGLCQSIANVSGARVRASTSWFHFRVNHKDGTDFEPVGFSGEVYVFEPKGGKRLESR